MITEKTNDKAKEIRHEASLKHGCPVFGDDGINRPACVGMAIRGEELPWKETAMATVVEIKTARNGEVVTVENRRIWVGKEYIGETFSPLNDDRKKQFPGMEWVVGCRLLLSQTEKERAENAIEEQTRVLVEKNREQQRETERGCKKIRVLTKSGRALMDEEIDTVYVLSEEEQEQYIEELKGRLVSSSIEGENYKVEIDDSETAKKITGRESSNHLFSHCPNESRIWIITEKEEKAILTECQVAKNAKIAKAKIEAEKEVKREIERKKEYAEMLEKHPDRAGKSECWECGCWSNRLDKNGYCGC